MKAIGAAVYLSSRNFSQFFAWIAQSLGIWCRETVHLLGENPLAVKEPKSYLQELLQAQELYEASSSVKGGRLPPFGERNSVAIRPH